MCAADIKKIVDIQLSNFEKLLDSRGLELQLKESAKSFLAEVGFDPAFGARPLKRALREYVLEPLSQKLIAGEIPPGAIIQVEHKEGRSLEFISLSNQSAVSV